MLEQKLLDYVNKESRPCFHYTEVYCESKLNIQTHSMANDGKSNLVV